MTIDWAEWGPPLAVLAFGLVAGIIAAIRIRMQEDTSVSLQGREQDLIQAHEAAVEALRSLELDQGKLSAEDYLHERQMLLTRGASALRELEAFRANRSSLPQEGPVNTPDDPKPPVADTPAQAPAPNQAQAQRPLLSPEWKGALTTLAMVAVAAILWQFAAQDSVPRREGASMTGNQDLGVPSEPSGEAPWAQAKANLEAQLAQNPNDVAVMNELTQLALSIDDPGLAMQYNQRALGVDPSNPDARTYKAVLAAFIGMTERALEDLEGVLRDVPDHPIATTYKGLALLELGAYDEAVAALERAVELQPGAHAIFEVLDQARAIASGEVPPPPRRAPAQAPPSGTSPHGAPDHPPVGAGTPGTPAGVATVLVEGTVELAPEQAGALTGSEVLFVSLRSPQGGPPLAAVRLPPGPFPVNFRVTTDDAIAMGGAPQAMPEQVNVTLRIDRDGNAMTREPGEPTAELNGVARGSTGLRAVLQ